jgi:hypothetical protein
LQQRKKLKEQLVTCNNLFNKIATTTSLDSKNKTVMLGTIGKGRSVKADHWFKRKTGNATGGSATDGLGIIHIGNSNTGSQSVAAGRSSRIGR